MFAVTPSTYLPCGRLIIESCHRSGVLGHFGRSDHALDQVGYAFDHFDHAFDDDSGSLWTASSCGQLQALARQQRAWRPPVPHSEAGVHPQAALRAVADRESPRPRHGGAHERRGSPVVRVLFHLVVVVVVNLCR